MSEILYRLLPIIASAGLLFYLFYLLRTHRVRERYVYLWFLLAIGMLILSVFPGAAFLIASFLGFETPANMLLAACSLILLLSAVSLSTAISGLEEDRRRFVEEIALLDARLRNVETDSQSDD